MQVTVSSMDVQKGELGLVSARNLQKGLTEICQGNLKGIDESVNIIEEQSTDVSSDDPGKYSYKGTYSFGENIYGATGSWLVINESGDILGVSCYVEEQGENADNVAKIRDLFDAKNSENALKVPGYNPPKEATTDGRLEVDSIHMGLVVPKDQFKKVDSGRDDLSVWSDDNGAMFIVAYDDAGEADFSALNEYQDQFMDAFKEDAETSLNTLLSDIESRMFLGNLQPPENIIGYYAEYKDQIGGIPYWEGYHSGLWFDQRKQEYTFYKVILMAPEKNKDIYKQIFCTAYDRLEDI